MKVDEVVAARDRDWIAALGLTSTSMEAAVNSLHNMERDAIDKACAAVCAECANGSAVDQDGDHVGYLSGAAYACAAAPIRKAFSK